jgi:hypothetical protein
MTYGIVKITCGLLEEAIHVFSASRACGRVEASELVGCADDLFVPGGK